MWLWDNKYILNTNTCLWFGEGCRAKFTATCLQSLLRSLGSYAGDNCGSHGKRLI